MARDEESQESQLPIASIPQSVALGQPLQHISLPVPASAAPPAEFQAAQIPENILKEELGAENKAEGGESEVGALPGGGGGAGAGVPLIQVLQPVVQSAHQSPALLVQSMPVLPPHVPEGGASGLGFDVAAVEGSLPLTTMPSGVPSPITSPTLQLQVPHLRGGSQQAILASAVDTIVLPNVSAKSIVWKYFGFPPLQGTLDVPDKTFTRCRLCRGKIPYKGQTTNMLKHLESKHRVDYESLKSKIGHVNFVGSCRKDARKRLRSLDSGAADALMKSSLAMPQSPASDSQHAEVGIIMGSDSDLPTMKVAAEILEVFGVNAEVSIVSAHRTPDRMLEYARNAHKRGIRVIIAGAGGAAHLPGMVAALTPLPVIGVPVVPTGSHLDGLDALMSIVQMPRGVPVATVAVGNSTNAGLLAVRILGASRPELLEAMIKYQEGMKDTVMQKADRLETVSWKNY